ncbi:MAG: hypothetical protein ACJAT2_001731 [Bacteriovoracaceae bacterium]|jgi:hypothetical protein
MALNIKPFEGPRAPDWTESVEFNEGLVATTGSHDQGSLDNSDAYLLLKKSQKKFEEGQGSLKKLDIL